MLKNLIKTLLLINSTLAGFAYSQINIQYWDDNGAIRFYLGGAGSSAPYTPPGTAITYDIFVDGTLAADAVGTYSIANRDTSGDKTAYKYIQNAVNVVTAGQTIGIRAGTYSPSLKITVSNKTGTDANNPIVIRAYAATTTDTSETVILDANGITYSTDSGYIAVSNSDYIYINGLTIRNCLYNGIVFGSGADYGRVENTVITNCTKRGIYIHSSNYTYVSNCLIYNNVIAGIQLNGASHCTIDRNECYDNGVGIMSTWYDNGKLVASYNTISNNLCYNNTNNPEGNDGIAVTTGSRHSTIINNICFGNYDDGIDVSAGGGQGSGGDIVDGYYQSVTLWNTVTGNICFNMGDGAGEGDGGGIKVSTNNGGGHLCGYNVVFDNEGSGFDQDKADGYPRNYFYNNVSYHNYYGIFLDHTCTEPNEAAILYNNLMAGNTYMDFRPRSGSVYDANNNFYADGTKYPSEDEATLSGDPKFNQPSATINTTFDSGWTIDQKLADIRSQVQYKFRLQSISTARNSGLIITDFHNPTAGDGVLWDWYGIKPDMGRYEYEE